MTWTIVNTLDLSGAPEAVTALQAAGRLVMLPPDRAQVLQALAEADAYLANARILIDQDFLDAAPRLKLIGSPSTGSDHMDLAAIGRRGIVRFDIAREYDLIKGFTATSELAFGLLLALIRRLKPAFSAAENGVWARERFTGFQLHGKTLGILGLGRLGTISARIGQGFGMNVIGCDVRRVELAGVRLVDFQTLLAESDVLTIHVHLTPETTGLIGTAELARMKPHAILLNTSRGRIVNELALLDALNSSQIAGAALDVIDGEWMTDSERARHPLIAYARANDNLLITPHIGGATSESIHGARIFIAKKVADWLRSSSTAVDDSVRGGRRPRR